jgi:hypothetical protein
MLRQSLAVLLVALVGVALFADDKKADKTALSGVWVLQGGQPKIEFADKGVMKIAPHGDPEVIVLIFEYTVDKDGVVKAKLTELEGKEEIKEKAKGSLPMGLKFSFKWRVKDDIATLDEVKGENAERFKSHLEGKYEKK